ncbi:MAG: hypothetical protein QME81_03685 [bacterium]|nr:hypothetical protein [bacterium]
MKKSFVVILVLAAIFFPFHGWADEDDMEKVETEDYFEAKEEVKKAEREKARASRNSITVEYYPLSVSSEIGWKFKEMCRKETWGGEKVTPTPIESASAIRIAYQPKRPLNYAEVGIAMISLDGIKTAYQVDINYILKPKDFISERFETYGSVGALIARLGGQRYIKDEGGGRYSLSEDAVDIGWGLQGFAGLRLNLTDFLALNGKAGYTYYSSLADLEREVGEKEYEKIPSEWREYSSIDLGGLTIKAGLTISF